MKDPALPFFVSWESPASEHPSSGASGVAIERIEMAGDKAAIAEWLQADPETLLDGIEVDWVDSEEQGLVAVWFATSHGSVRID